MRKKALPALLFILSCSGSVFAQQNTGATDPIAQKVEALMAKMTLEEKIGQLNQYTSDRLATGPLTPNSSKYQEIKDGKVGSMLNVKGAKETRMIQEMAMQSRLKIPLLFGLDVIHGYRVTFPIPLAEAASWDLNAIELSARVAGKESAAAGVHWTFAPMVDIARDPRWGRVMEGAGEDTYLGSLIAKARVRGFQGKGLGNLDAIMACAKHFAAYGAAIAGRDYNTVDMSDRQLWETYLPPFKAAVDAGAATFMNSFNDLNGIPATGNAYLQRDILKDKWNYQGFVVSDWGSISEMVAHGFAKDNKDAARLAILAGSDMDMEGHAYLPNLVQLVQEKKIDVALINDAVRRILRKKFELGLFDDPYRFSNESREKKVLNAAENRKAAREVAEKSIVLLKNDNQLLPLSKSTKKIAVIGPLGKSSADMKGFWSVTWDNDHLVSLYEGLQNKLGKQTELLYSEGCGIKDTSRQHFAEAVATAKQADVVIMAVGEAFDMSGEAKSRSNIHLPGVQEELIKAVQATGKPVVVLVMAGRPLIFNWTADNANAILYTWWLGSEAGNAMADVLFGDYNPAGKLPMSFPRAEGQIPVFYASKSTGRPALDEKNTNYRSAYLDLPNSPRYAFGYGLSYSNFDFSDLKLNKSKLSQNETLQVSFTLKNTGKYAGEEVAQLYLQDVAASVTRPVKELKDFQKVFLKPGESKTISFTIDKEKLSFYDQKMTWGAEAGEFKLMIGNSSDHILLQDKFELVD
ncbi:glycoside hydrolase family 3 C-terminal domain-containing protein [Mucilaginibacter sp. Bleaf8]|uniref:glycoside hydrolase family 3 N-terminal domain-containing protein n=1 Tax=Mucilaginibacter sp. Bleaf8 TaxID=2834430 RepID=UPI001BCAE3C0|nr:glycoside hydrolase family 3 N-terminal domain-containing protein [Mucilaginibacter sp. Bleaf8]MBS7566872.1 glycoside hydrolase family 3 C-terminal domain-containing protein [Mucilaginibacter sp. Bleaf8]